MADQETLSEHLGLLDAYSQVVDRLIEVQKLLASLLEEDLYNRINLLRMEVEGRRGELLTAVLEDVQAMIGGG